MAKAQKEGVFLVSSEGTGYFYTYRKNKKKGKAGSKLSIKKYDPIARKHVTFEEKKLSALKKKYNRDAAAKASESKPESKQDPKGKKAAGSAKSKAEK
ncbi:MAG: 50S ribosomal protein L33 [Deltaproteobacteria bacterium]|nr:50S ribosomal protein L33 [Deltaproteobacteria bacterium]